MRARAPIVKLKKFLNVVSKIIQAKPASRVSDYDVHRGSDDASDPYMHASVGQNAEEIWIQHVDEDRIETLRILFYCRKTVELDKYDHVAPFLEATLIPCDHCAHMSVSIEEVHLLRDIVWKASDMAPMSRSRIFGGQNEVRDI